MTDAEHTRLSNLTTDALRAAGDKTVDDIRSMLKTADAMHAKLHSDGEQFIADIGKQVLGITDSVSAYVAFCQQTVKMFNAAGEAARKLNGTAEVAPARQLVEEDKTRRIPRRDWEGELSKIQASVASDIDGRR
jgi:hypothetical protein